MKGVRSMGLMLCLSILALSNTALGQQDETVDVSVNMSTQAVHIGDLVDVELSINHPAGSEVRIPELRRGKQLVTRNEVVERKDLRKDRVKTTIFYQVSSFEIGQHDLFTNGIVYTLEDKSTQTSAPPFALLKVESIRTEGESDPRPIKELARWPSRLPLVLLGLLVVAVLAILIALMVRRFSHGNPSMTPGPPPAPPHEVALSALADLKEKGWIEEQKVEPFYVELSSIVRLYLEKRFNLRAPEQTTEEFIRAAAGSQHLRHEHRALTSAFLEQSDLVKFARYMPDQSMMTRAWESAESLVRETMPAPTPEEEGPHGTS